MTTRLMGSLFLFVNRRRDRMKLLHFDGGGFWLYYRLLEAGTFEELVAEEDACRLQIDATQLSMLLAGVSLGSVRQTTQTIRRSRCLSGCHDSTRRRHRGLRTGSQRAEPFFLSLFQKACELG